jgi:hypothetical protein
VFEKRTPGLLPPPVRRFLAKQGDTAATRIEIVRTPVSNFLETLLSTLSLGKWRQATRQAGYDRAFHLGVLCNGDTLTDKQEVVRVSRFKRTRQTQSLSVDVPAPGVTFKDLLDRTREKVGDVAFTGYDARRNNCQSLVWSLLRANGLGSDAARQFVLQDAEAIFSRTPAFVDRVGKVLTDTAAVADRVTEGQKVPRSKPTWRQYYAEKDRGKKFANRAEVNSFMKTTAAQFRSLA